MKATDGRAVFGLLMTGLAAAHVATAREAAGTGSHAHAAVPDTVIAAQRAALARNTRDKGFGPQAPRDITRFEGRNPVAFSFAPPAERMNLCNIHFHKHAEHRGPEFARYAGNGDGHGYGSGYRFDVRGLTAAELAPVGEAVCESPHGSLRPGDTIEVHYVYTTARVKPGPTLGSCLDEATKNPQLRVEAQVYVLVNDPGALDFAALTRHGRSKDGRYQAFGLPDDTGTPVVYAGSTTGPGYNEQGSPYQVTWSVRPKVARVDIRTVGRWCKGNAFDEDHAHGVRNLVENPDLLSPIAR